MKAIALPPWLRGLRVSSEAALVAEALADGATVVVATHEPSLVERFDRCLVLADGTVTFDGPPDELADGHHLG